MAKDKSFEQPEDVPVVKVCSCGAAGDGGRDLGCKKHGKKE